MARGDDRGRDRDYGDDEGYRDRGRGRDVRDERDDGRSRDRDRDRESSRTRSRDDDDRDNRRDRDRSRDRGNDDRRDGGSRSSGRRPEYVPRDQSTLDRHQNQATGSWEGIFPDDIKKFKAREGLNRIRILQSTYGTRTDYSFGYYQHNDIGPDRGAYLCARKMAAQPCPMCDNRSEFDEEDSKALRPQHRYILWIIDRNNERAGPQIWDVSAKTDKLLANLSVEDGKVLNIDSPDDGYDIEFRREGTGRNTDYLAHRVMRDPSPLHDDDRIADQWLDYIADHPLDKVLQEYDAEHIERAFGGQVNRREEDLDEEDDRRSGRGGKRGRERMRNREDRDGGRDRLRDRGRGRGRDEEVSRSMRDELDDDIPDHGEPRSDDRENRNRDEPRGGLRGRDDDRGSSRGRDHDDGQPRGRGRSRDDEDDNPLPDEEEPRRGRGRDDDPPPRSRDDDVPRGRDRGRDRDEEEDVSSRTRDRLHSMAERRGR